MEEIAARCDSWLLVWKATTGGENMVQFSRRWQSAALIRTATPQG